MAEEQTKDYTQHMRNVVSKMLQDFIVKQKINYNTIFKDQYLIKYFEACYLELEDENMD